MRVDNPSGPTRSRRPHARFCFRLAAALALALAPCAIAASQTPAPAIEWTPDWRAAASDETVWLANAGSTSSAVMRRSLFGDFGDVERLPGRIAAIFAIGNEALAFLDNGSVYRGATDGWSRGLDPPTRLIPIEAVALRNTLYAIAPAAQCAGTPLFEPADASSSQAVYEPGDEPFAIVRFDGRWTVIAAVPPIITGELHPRLGFARGNLALFWAAQDQVLFALFNVETQRWETAGAVGIPGLRNFWVCEDYGVTTIVAFTGAATDERIAVFRQVGDEPSRPFRKSSCQFAPIPGEARTAEVVQAFAFNQHIGVMLRADRESWVIFGRPGAPPLEKTIALGESMPALPGTAAPQNEATRMAMLLLLLGVVAALVLLRRGSLSAQLPLPADAAPALTLQRLAAGAIDLLPFCIASGWMTGVDPRDGFQALLDWFYVGNQPGAGVPPRPVLLWWSASVSMYVTYSLIMELAARRTIGKVLLRLRIVSETGDLPGAVQILVRNFARLVELLPPFWILAFLVILSRNRQRLGDIFARTVVVRRIRITQDEQR